NFQKICQSPGVYPPVWRELKQDRTQLRPEVGGSREQIVYSILRILQLLIVGDEAAAFNRKDEVGGGGFAPVVEGAGIRQPIEAVVQFDGIELLRVELQHLGRGQLPGIEGSCPVFVMEARGADADVAGHAQEWMTVRGAALSHWERLRRFAGVQAKKSGLEFGGFRKSKITLRQSQAQKFFNL